jgi:3-oxoadipate enol-lactonase
MPICTLPTVSLAYRLEGRPGRPVLVLSNSLGTDFGMWDPQVPHLTEHVRVLRYDSRGHGASTVARADFGIADMAQDVIDLANHLEIDQFAFCGLSLGGLVGQHLGIHHGQRLTRLVLSSTAPYLPPKENWDARVKAVREHGMGAIVDVVMQRFFSEGYRAKSEPLEGTMRTTFLATDPEGYAGACLAIRDADYRADLGRVSTPTLCIGGTLDVSTPPAIGADVLAQTIPGAVKVTLSAAHISNVEQPEAYTKTLLDFLIPRR